MSVRPETMNRASQLASVFSSLKSLGLADRGVFLEIMRRVLVANSGWLGVWTVWEPNALDGLDTIFAGTSGHDQTGRFVPFWHRYGGRIRLEANIDYDKPEADWYLAPARRRAEVLIDPYQYRVAGKELFITSMTAPILHDSSCLGVVGFDVHLDWLLEAADEPNLFESVEASFGRGHVLLGEDGRLRYCSRATFQLICRYVGSAPVADDRLPGPLDDLVARKIRRSLFPGRLRQGEGWTFVRGLRKLAVRLTRHPYAGSFLLLVDEQVMDGSSMRGALDLSPREREVAEWVAQGKSNEEIAIILGISAHTVKNHMDKIFRKLGVENRCSAAIAVERLRFAARNGCSPNGSGA
jgi:DNA-binding CsgD family transcriptional regulator